MTRLILVRHAKSSWDDPELEDFDRPLGKRGRRDAPAMGAWLRAGGHEPEAALVSSAARAVQTFARLFQGATPPPARFLDALYLADTAVMLGALRGARGERVLMVGHNPGIGAFATRLLGLPPDDPDYERFPTCATAVIDFASGWDAVDWHSGRLVDFMTPKRLAR
ncbi:SixA phosphatase family protein [Amaricoccus solimangrovi]|uniref:Histidine phosphatase family protein n=1 Tax=Amaricoccus solimangrovi TaxID=2589815 RepID=A0A501WNK0_9RHOB|nr:histidine phosphatase family protein [Amaricoccus solimangrovi]TPE50422.1 histidine phosphatase family protein [Amaricoccus solimangrovi]